jgi:hypothetical protein
MSIRVCAANMESLGTQRFSGFQKDLWNPKSEKNLAFKKIIYDFISQLIVNCPKFSPLFFGT